jgi:hypothetical protein
MLEGVPDAISASAYGLGSDRVRESLRQPHVNANAGCGAQTTKACSTFKRKTDRDK